MGINGLFDHPTTSALVSGAFCAVSGLFAAVGWLQLRRAEHLRLAPSISVFHP